MVGGVCGGDDATPIALDMARAVVVNPSVEKGVHGDGVFFVFSVF